MQAKRVLCYIVSSAVEKNKEGQEHQEGREGRILKTSGVVCGLLLACLVQPFHQFLIVLFVLCGGLT